MGHAKILRETIIRIKQENINSSTTAKNWQNLAHLSNTDQLQVKEAINGLQTRNPLQRAAEKSLFPSIGYFTFTAVATTGCILYQASLVSELLGIASALTTANIIYFIATLAILCLVLAGFYMTIKSAVEIGQRIIYGKSVICKKSLPDIQAQNTLIFLFQESKKHSHYNNDAQDLASEIIKQFDQIYTENEKKDKDLIYRMMASTMLTNNILCLFSAKKYVTRPFSPSLERDVFEKEINSQIEKAFGKPIVINPNIEIDEDLIQSIIPEQAREFLSDTIKKAFNEVKITNEFANYWSDIGIKISDEFEKLPPLCN